MNSELPYLQLRGENPRATPPLAIAIGTPPTVISAVGDEGFIGQVVMPGDDEFRRATAIRDVAHCTVKGGDLQVQWKGHVQSARRKYAIYRHAHAPPSIFDVIGFTEFI